MSDVSTPKHLNGEAKKCAFESEGGRGEREGAMSTKRESDRGLGSERKIFAADGSPRKGARRPGLMA